MNMLTKLYTQFKKAGIVARHSIGLMLCLFFVFAILISGTHAWSGLTSARGDFSGRTQELLGNGQFMISKEVIGVHDADATDTVFAFEVIIGEEASRDYHYSVYDDNGKLAQGSIKSGETVLLKGGQWMVFEDIDAGTHYHVVEQEMTDFTAHVINKSGQVLPTGSRASFLNAQNAINYGQLIITKEVVIPEQEIEETERGSESDRSLVQSVGEEQTFEFVIIIGEEIHNISLKDGESHTMDGIAKGTSYQVVEANYSDEGYATTGIGTQGTMMAGENIAAIVNTMVLSSPAGNYGTLRLEKHVTGAGADLDKAFIFHIRIGEQEPEIRTLKSGEYVEFENIPVGTQYQIVEENYYHEGYQTSSSGASGTIVAGRNLATYTNEYEEALTMMGELSVEKIVLREEGLRQVQSEEGQEFLFRVIFSDGNDYPFVRHDGSVTSELQELVDEELVDGKLHLKHGEQAVFRNLPVGVRYEVAEESVEGYLQETIRTEGTLRAGSNETIFRNYELLVITPQEPGAPQEPTPTEPIPPTPEPTPEPGTPPEPPELTPTPESPVTDTRTPHKERDTPSDSVKQADEVRTGDENERGIWLLFFAASAVVIKIIFIKKRKCE